VDGAFRDDRSNSSGESGTLPTTDGDTHAAAVDGPAEGNGAATDNPDDVQTADPDAILIAGIDVGITPRDAAGAAEEKREEGRHNALSRRHPLNVNPNSVVAP